jgi:group I intron endonuclease
MMKPGIYIIKNITNNKIYVGSSVNLPSREYKHFWMLKKGVHDNHYLQQSYNKHGKDSFIFEVVELCNTDELITKENYYIDTYQSNNYEYGYNLAKVNEFRRNTYNDDVKLKLSKHNQKKNNNFINYSLTNIDNGEIFIFDNLVDGANYLISNGFTLGKPQYVRVKLSSAIRGKKMNNGSNGSIRKTIYKHKFSIINN